jgi:RNA polymerase sigma-70 factor (ECF subfamily)
MEGQISGESFTVDQLKAGDERAWNDAFTCFYGLAFNVLEGVFYSLQEADLEDVVQDAIISLIDNYVQTAGSIDDLKKLVITIAKNKAKDLIDYQNAQRRDMKVTDSLDVTDDDGQPIVSEKNRELKQTTPADMADKKEQALLVREAMKQLPQKQSDLLWDYYFEDLKQQEIAGKYRIKLNSVGGYLNRALEALEKILKKNKLL